MNIINYTIERKKLMKYAEKKDSNRFVYIQAPAGYGKTVFSGHWLNAGKNLGTTLSLDEYDNTIYDLCNKLKIMLEELYPDNVYVLSFTRHRAFDSAPTEFIMRAATAVPKDSEAEIVIDDLHCITSLDVQKLLHRFLIRLPLGIRVLLLSRMEPPMLFCDFFSQK